MQEIPKNVRMASSESVKCLRCQSWIFVWFTQWKHLLWWLTWLSGQSYSELFRGGGSAVFTSKKLCCAPFHFSLRCVT